MAEELGNKICMAQVLSVFKHPKKCQVFSEFILPQVNFKVWFKDLIVLAEISKEKDISTTSAAKNSVVEG